MTGNIIATIIRWLITTSGVALVLHLDNNSVEQLVGAIATIVSLAWGIWNARTKRTTDPIVATVTGQPVPPTARNVTAGNNSDS